MLSPVSTWMGDRLGTLGAVGIIFLHVQLTAGLHIYNPSFCRRYTGKRQKLVLMKVKFTKTFINYLMFNIHISKQKTLDGSTIKFYFHPNK